MPFLRDGTEYGWKKRQGVCYFSSGQLRSWELAKRGTKYLKNSRGVVLRRWRNRMGRPLSPPQIHQKNIWTLSKFHKTTSECWQGTSGTQKSSPLSLKGGRKIYKRQKKNDKRGRDGAPSLEGSLKKREVSKHQETLSLPRLWRALEPQRAS